MFFTGSEHYLLQSISDLASNLQDSSFLNFQHRPLSKRSASFGEYWINEHTVISNITSGVFTLHGKMLLKLWNFLIISDSFVAEILVNESFMAAVFIRFVVAHGHFVCACAKRIEEHTEEHHSRTQSCDPLGQRHGSRALAGTNWLACFDWLMTYKRIKPEMIWS